VFSATKLPGDPIRKHGRSRLSTPGDPIRKHGCSRLSTIDIVYLDRAYGSGERGLRRKRHTLLDAFRSFSFAHAHIQKITVYSGDTENRRKRYVKNVSVIPCDIPI